MQQWEYRRFGMVMGPLSAQRVRDLAAAGFFQEGDEFRPSADGEWAPLSAYTLPLGLPPDPRTMAGYRPAAAPTPAGPADGTGPVRVVIAGWWSRLAAAAIDGVVLALAGTVLAVLTTGGGTDAWLGWTLLLGIPYLVGCHATRRGQTLGKAVLGIRVCDARTGGGITAPVAFLRFLPVAILPVVALVVLVVFAFVAALCIAGFCSGVVRDLISIMLAGAALLGLGRLLTPLLLDDRARAPHDRLAGTLVVRAR